MAKKRNQNSTFSTNSTGGKFSKSTFRASGRERFQTINHPEKMEKMRKPFIEPFACPENYGVPSGEEEVL